MKDFQLIPKNQIFTREQLKAIRGGDDGYYGGGCTVPGTKCTSESDCGGNCPKCVAIPHQDYSICATS